MANKAENEVQEVAEVKPKAKKVRPLGAVYNTRKSTNAMLQTGVSKRFPNITLFFADKNAPGGVQEVDILKDGEEGGKYNSDTVMAVLAITYAMSSRTSGGGDGALLWLHENIGHPRVAGLLKDDNKLRYEVASDRTGANQYEFTGKQIKDVVMALAPAVAYSVKEFGVPAPATRGPSAAIQEDEEVEWDVL